MALTGVAGISGFYGISHGEQLAFLERQGDRYEHTQTGPATGIARCGHRYHCRVASNSVAGDCSWVFGLGSDGAAPMHDLPNSRCRDMDVHSELMLANLKRLQELLQQYFTGMSRNTLKRPACRGLLDSMHVFFP